MDGPKCMKSHTIDPRGDLWLCVGEVRQATSKEKPCQFQVCSRTMARVSDSFDAMLYRNGWREAKPEAAGKKPWVVNLPDDSPATTKELLPAMYGNLRLFGCLDMSSSANIEIRRIFELFVLADKYGWLQTLGPWSVSWFEACGAFVDSRDLDALLRLSSGGLETFGMLAYIAYLLCNKTFFKRIMTILTIPKAIANSERIRLRAGMLKKMKGVITSLDGGDPAFRTQQPVVRSCNIPAEQAACATRNLGIIADRLDHAELVFWRVVLPDEIDVPPRGLLLSLREVYSGWLFSLRAAACAATAAVDDKYEYVPTDEQLEFLTHRAGIVSTSYLRQGGSVKSKGDRGFRNVSSVSGHYLTK
ncbi:hypothetical protein Micbo1qcDRAFT_181225 [Microdochium bolleyi]|uniref:BTB domain-containing protein n=1 Tax=Microdochium bolleyi TaxID=196109 RepID=A0A136IJ20_9PEZI|nr:hypothetical protein Micbo1qcDRAFT_181225 [Microdochium bolleyi]